MNSLSVLSSRALAESYAWLIEQGQVDTAACADEFGTDDALVDDDLVTDPETVIVALDSDADEQARLTVHNRLTPTQRIDWKFLTTIQSPDPLASRPRDGNAIRLERDLDLLEYYMGNAPSREKIRRRRPSQSDLAAG